MTSEYMGGHLSTFLYAAPLLKPYSSSRITSVCLRNSATWDSLETFLSGYQAIPDVRTLKQLTQVEPVEIGRKPWPMANYTTYRLCGPLFRSFGELLPKKQFSKWFYALFFRLALPYRVNLSNYCQLTTQPNHSVSPYYPSPRTGISIALALRSFDEYHREQSRDHCSTTSMFPKFA